MTPSFVSPSGVEPSRFPLLRFAAAALALIAAAGPASAQSGIPWNIEGLTVIGEGSVSAAPDVAEIDLDVSAAAEITGDAIVKFRDAKKRILEAFEGLKLPNVAVEERGLLVDQKGAMNNPYVVDYGMAQKAKVEVQLSRKLVVKATGLRAMEEDAALQLVGRLLDVAQDAGARVGPPQSNPYYGIVYSRQQEGPALARFVLEDAGAIREQAYEKAVADARKKAERLARLSGVELGPIVAIRETSSTATPTRYIIDGIDVSDGAGGDDERAGQRLESSKLRKIPVRVELQIRFEIRPAGKEKAPTQ